MILRQPSYKFILVFLIIPILSSLIIFLTKSTSSTGSFLQVLLSVTLFIAVGVIPPLLLFYYWDVTKTAIDQCSKTVILIVYRLHFFKIRAYKFNGKEVWLEIRKIDYFDSGYVWKLYLRHPAVVNGVLIMESALGGTLIRKAKEIKTILNCRLDNPQEKL
ncbi:MAG: hypothetical protein Q8N62_04120 [Candidatus Omnitrophota bacterium]|nr:hypothetical protein [Candidatus Omnitrophota bacterium]